MANETIQQRWLNCAGKNRGSLRQQLCQLAFRSLVAGQPLPVATARAQLGWSDAAFATLVAEAGQKGVLTLNGRGDEIIGASGLSLSPSRHVLLLQGRHLYTWCALDAVGIPDARIESACTDTGERVWIEITNGKLTQASHPTLTISLVAPAGSQSVRDGLCGEIGFYCQAEPAPQPNQVFLSVEEAMALGRTLWADGAPL